MQYKTEQIPGGKLYTNDERTGIFEKQIDGRFGIYLYSHPGGKHAWDKSFVTTDEGRARTAALRWTRDGVDPGQKRAVIE